jgi:hypothetical protein
MTRRPISLPGRFARLCLAVLVALGPVAGAQAQVSTEKVQATQAFDDGTRQLEAGDFRGAVRSFQRAEELGLASGPLYYNRGVAHYRLDEIGRAVQYFEKASRLLEDQTRVRHSLDIVSSRLTDTFSELPVPIWKRLQRAVLSVASVTTFMATGLVAFLAFCAILLLSVLGLWAGPWFRRARLVSGMLAFVLLATAFTSSIWPAYPPEAVVISDRISMHEQPDGEAAELEEIHAGLVVGLISEADGWMLVQLPNGVRGWVESAGMGVV